MNTKNNPGIKMKINSAVIRLLIGISLVAFGTIHAASLKTWVGTAGNNLLSNTNNWSPLTTTLPSASGNDTILFNGSQAGSLVLTNNSAFDASPGLLMQVAGTQTGSLTIVQTNGGTGRIRFGTNSLIVNSGAGAVTIGNSGATPFPIALGTGPNGTGNGTVHAWTNNSANTVTLGSDIFFLMGGGGAHTLALSGTNNWLLNSSFQAQNSGSTLALTINGSGTVNLVGTPTPTVTYLGSYGSLTVNSGTLQLGGASAIGNGAVPVLGPK